MKQTEVNNIDIRAMSKEQIPEGYRKLSPGEKVKDGDIHLNRRGKWLPSPMIGRELKVDTPAPHARPSGDSNKDKNISITFGSK